MEANINWYINEEEQNAMNISRNSEENLNSISENLWKIIPEIETNQDNKENEDNILTVIRGESFEIIEKVNGIQLCKRYYEMNESRGLKLKSQRRKRFKKRLPFRVSVK